MTRLTIEETAQWLKNCEDVYILIHHNPDGDCVGAGYALAEAFHSLGKRAAVVAQDEIPPYLSHMVPTDPQAFQPDFPAQHIIAVDTADPKLFGEDVQAKYGDLVELCIDHHISNIGYAQRLCLMDHAAAACEVMYTVIREMGVTLNDYMGLCLYSGIATDSGSFQYDYTSPNTLRVAADIKEDCPNVNYARLNRKLFRVKSMERLKFEQILIDYLEQYLEGRLTLICVTQEMMEKHHIAEETADGIANFPLQVEGTEVSVTMKEKEPNVFKISMRSADTANVSAICQQFGGGGHIKASGCVIEGTAEEVKQRIISAVEKGI